ncbi:MAG: PspA/IM30 family protein [Methyloprofundus sp.]|nr:PspA/IM30 family protein [Methyloprofundus sp.]
MSIWSKVITALRGSANEAGEAIADTQALRILDQEIRDATEELQVSQESLVEMMAKQKVAEQKCTTLNSKITEFEDYALQVLEKNNDEPLVLELAEKFAELGKQLNSEQNVYHDYSDSVNSLRNATKQADRNIKHLKHQLETIRATENVQRAQAAVAQRHSASTSRLSTAMDSLERIKEKQTLKNAQLNAEQELAEDISDDSLKDRLEAAGIVPESLTGTAVLARLKSKTTLRIESDKNLDE